jgi:hypothetical protein
VKHTIYSRYIFTTDLILIHGYLLFQQLRMVATGCLPLQLLTSDLKESGKSYFVLETPQLQNPLRATLSVPLSTYTHIYIYKLRGFSRKRTIPTERPPIVGQISANFCGQRVSHGQRNGFPRPLI